MYGSDWPVCLPAAGYDEVLTLAETLTAGLGTEDREAVFGTTAAHWDGVGARPPAGCPSGPPPTSTGFSASSRSVDRGGTVRAAPSGSTGAGRRPLRRP
ncbi:amidohydrolase family protein [Streptomyces sp. NPDC060275]|uniref:amidohydrolase family protein n=1 Tax=Streptomyces sp. NPDC060275 TaxID=3347090 RepID=UPI0036590E9A